MTASTLRSFASGLPDWRRLLALCCLLWLGWQTPARAEDSAIELQYFEIVATDSQYLVNASARLKGNQRLEDLIEAGVSIPFVIEFVLTRPRWYWTDEVVVQRSLDMRLSFHALTRQYRVTVGSLHRSFPNYEDALAAIFSVRNWAVSDLTRLRRGESYGAALRMRLDVAQLPKPFQVASIGNRDFDINTGWVKWTFLAAAD